MDTATATAEYREIMDIAPLATISTEQAERIIGYFEHIPVRDAILSAIGSDPAARERIAWIASEIENVRGALDAPLRTTLAAISYLNGDYAVASNELGLVTDDYSLADLLRAGLMMQAPAALLARSFSHLSPEELLELPA